MPEMHEHPPASQAAVTVPFKIPRKPVGTGYQLVQSAPSVKPQVQPRRNERKIRATSRVITWLKSLPDRSWLPEITSLVLAWVAFSAIIITLVTHKGRPIPQWPHFISINSLLAIFTAILKAALIMPIAEGIGQLKWDWFRRDRALVDLDRLDSASRGPRGSFLLLNTSYKHYLASFGALITVAALAIEPLSQQVIRYTYCRQPVSGLAPSLSTTSNYSRYGSYLDDDLYSLDLEMTSALYVGLISPPANASSAIPFACQTGNCTFAAENDIGATHMSLAMCGECKDISDTIITKDYPNGLNGSYGVAPAVQHSLPPPGEGQPSANITVITDNFLITTNWLASQISQSSGSGGINALEAIMFRNCSCPRGSANELVCTCEPFATRCSIFPCIKTYKAEVKDFVLVETELSREKVGDQYADLFGFWTWKEKTLRRGRWINCSNSSELGAEFDSPMLNVTAFLSNTNNTASVVEYTQEGCAWTFGLATTTALNSYIASNVWYGGLDAPIELNSPEGAYGSPWFEAMFHNGSASSDTPHTYINGLANARADQRQGTWQFKAR